MLLVDPDRSCIRGRLRAPVLGNDVPVRIRLLDAEIVDVHRPPADVFVGPCTNAAAVYGDKISCSVVQISRDTQAPVFSIGWRVALPFSRMLR